MPNPIIERAMQAIHDCECLLDAEECEMLVRAVLRAIREPSEGIIKAGSDPSCDLAEVGQLDALLTWQSMIDAALGEG